MNNTEENKELWPEEKSLMKAEISRRKFITSATLAAVGLALAPYATLAAETSNKSLNFASFVEINTTINGQKMKMKIDPRTSLLDLLREQLGLTGSKKAVIKELVEPVPYTWAKTGLTVALLLPHKLMVKK